jgi:hypothetical protein
VTADFFVWDVSATLVTASYARHRYWQKHSLMKSRDYALQITQGQDDINYSGLFSITGGTGISSNSTSSTITTATIGNYTASITGIGTAASLGTGTAMSRNTTFRYSTIVLLAKFGIDGI